MMTTYERGKIEGRRESVLLQLEKKLGPLDTAVKQRVEALSAERVQQLLLDLIDSRSIKELHLED
jgi:Domain of unknown function (DUF4351)